MTPDDLAAIRARNQKHIASEQTRSDVRALLAEVNFCHANHARIVAHATEAERARIHAAVEGLLDDARHWGGRSLVDRAAILAAIDGDA